MKRVVLLGDLHCGQAAGLTPPGWIVSEERKPKLHKMQQEMWSKYRALIRKLGPIDVLIANGDLIDGKGTRSGGTELIENDLFEQGDMAVKALQIWNADTTICTYGCLTPGHRILTTDLRWVPVESLKIGDDIVGFEENVPAPGYTRRWKDAKVTANKLIKKEVADILLSDGSKLTATWDHPFLVKSDTAYRWRTVKTMYDYVQNQKTKGKDATKLLFYRSIPVWEEDDTYEGGYISGFFDREGCLSYSDRKRKDSDGRAQQVFNVGAEQNPTPTLDRIIRLLKDKEVEHSITDKQCGRLTKHIRILGSYMTKLLFIGRFKIKRLIDKLDWNILGSIKCSDKDGVYITDIVDAGEQEVCGLSTSTGTYVSEGFLSHNTPYHTATGSGEDIEQIIAEKLEAEIHSHAFVDVEGLVFDVKHKVGSSAIPWGKHTAISRERIQNMLWNDVAEGQPRANVFIRSHVHYHNYCGGPGWLAMTLPALQGPHTKYGARQCSGVVDWGVVVMDVDKGNIVSWKSEIIRLNNFKADVIKV